MSVSEPYVNMNTLTTLHRPDRISGFTLMEVLVALVILSIGLLGLAGLQAAGLRYNHSSYLRSQATLLAYDIVDRMRANRQEALNGSYNIALGTSPAAPASCTGSAAFCTPAQLKDDDLYQWETALKNTLPSGTGGITMNGTQFTITVQWTDDQTPGAPAQKFSLMTAL